MLRSNRGNSSSRAFSAVNTCWACASLAAERYESYDVRNLLSYIDSIWMLVE